HMSRKAIQLVSGRPGGPDASVLRATYPDDLRNVDQSLDIVDRGRLVEQSGFGRIRRLTTRLAAGTFDGIEQRCFLSADIRPGAAPQLHVEAEPAAQDIFAEHAHRPRRSDRLTEPPGGERILTADIDIAALGADGDRADEHAFENRQWVPFHQDPV